MSRITRNKLYIEIAKLFSQRSSCGRLQVGCVIVNDGRIICSGYNGTLEKNYSQDGRCSCDLSKPCEKAIHAEANAISYAAKNGIALKNSALYCTHSPCIKCSELIIQAGINSVHYDTKFRDEAGLKFLKSNGVSIQEF